MSGPSRVCWKLRIAVAVSLPARSFSTTTRRRRADPQAIADAFLSKFANGQTFERKQLLDANQLRLFSLTLDRPHLWPRSHLFSKSLASHEPSPGTPVPPGYHWTWFTPAQLPGILGLDGTDASFNPDVPFTRRMWAGGSVEWPGAQPGQSSNSLLQVGDTVTEVTKVLSCEPKIIKKTGESMLVVGVIKEFRDSKDNLCVVDRRNWVFREALDPSQPSSMSKKPAELSNVEIEEQNQGKVVRNHTRDVVQLFRFSALTFNAHRIHYDKPWATQVEGHRDVVVHGPMNFLAMVDLWRDEMVKQGRGSSRDEILYPQKVEYRATSPVYASEGYRVMMSADSSGKKTDLQVVSNDGTTCMKGTVTDW